MNKVGEAERRDVHYLKEYSGSRVMLGRIIVVLLLSHIEFDMSSQNRNLYPNNNSLQVSHSLQRT